MQFRLEAPTRIFSGYTVEIATAVVWLVAFPVHSGALDDWARMRLIAPKGYVCHRARAPLQIDGRLEEASWKGAPWTDHFVDI